jgi:LacI family transcriptional regulator
MTAPSTIADIAARAGVGTATVDRVLNKRPGVNVETMQRVMQVVAELGAPPLRGRPRKGDNFRFAYVLPADDTPFLGLVDRQIAQAAGDFRHQHITEVTHRLDTRDPAQFAASLAQVADCEGVALMAPDLPAVKLAINELVRSGVHVVTLFSDVAGSMRETHIGADNRGAGRTAGLLLGRMARARSGAGGEGSNAVAASAATASAGARDTLLLSSQATRLSAEIERRIGYAQVIEERFPGLRMLRTPDLPVDDDGAAKALLRFLKKGVDPARVAGIYNVGSGTAGVARAMASLAAAGGVVPAAGALARALAKPHQSALQNPLDEGAIAVVGHDYTDPHRTLLGAGALSYVLHQDIHYCVLTAARVLRALCENVRGALNVVQPRIEILTAENLY